MANMTPKKDLSSKLERVFEAKYLALLVSLLLLLIGILAIFLGAIRLVESIIQMSSHEGKPGLHLIESVDTLLFSLVIIVLSGGIYKLFVGNENTFSENVVFSKIKTFMDLKVLLWETLLLTLTVWCALGFFINPESQNYEQLILPVSIVLLALALKFIKGVK